MSDYFENINLQDIDLAEYNSIDIGFTREQKENLKKELRKKITKRKSKKNSIAAAVAVVLITAAVFSNGSNVLAKVEPRFNEIYENLGFKKQYLSEKDYVGKTYENNGIKVTLDNFVVSKHLAQFALKVQYSDKWTSSQRSQISCGLDFHWKFGGFTDINTKTIDDNTELKVVSYTSQDELKKKGKYTIKVTSDDFNEPIVWNMNIDFSKNFSKTIERQVTMLKDLGINIKKIEAEKMVQLLLVIIL